MRAALRITYTAKQSFLFSKSDKRNLRISHARRARASHARTPVSLSVFSFTPDLLFDCSRVLEYAKIQTVLESKYNPTQRFDMLLLFYCLLGSIKGSRLYL